MDKIYIVRAFNCESKHFVTLKIFSNKSHAKNYLDYLNKYGETDKYIYDIEKDFLWKSDIGKSLMEC